MKPLKNFFGALTLFASLSALPLSAEAIPAAEVLDLETGAERFLRVDPEPHDARSRTEVSARTKKVSHRVVFMQNLPGLWKRPMPAR